MPGLLPDADSEPDASRQARGGDRERGDSSGQDPAAISADESSDAAYWDAIAAQDERDELAEPDAAETALSYDDDFGVDTPAPPSAQTPTPTLRAQKGWAQRASERIVDLRPRQLMLLLAVAHFSAAIPVMLAGHWMAPRPEAMWNLAHYQARVLELFGGITAHQTSAFSPFAPLDGIVWIVPSIFGIGGLPFGLLLSTATMMAGMLFWMRLQYANKGHAIAGMLLIVTNPLSWYAGLVILDDGPLIALFVLIVIVHLCRSNRRAAATWASGAAIASAWTLPLAWVAAMMPAPHKPRTKGPRPTAVVAAMLTLLVAILVFTRPGARNALYNLDVAGLGAMFATTWSWRVTDAETSRVTFMSLWSTAREIGPGAGPSWSSPDGGFVLFAVVLGVLAFLGTRPQRHRVGPVQAAAMALTAILVTIPVASIGSWLLFTVATLPWLVRTRRGAWVAQGTGFMLVMAHLAPLSDPTSQSMLRIGVILAAVVIAIATIKHIHRHGPPMALWYADAHHRSAAGQAGSAAGSHLITAAAAGIIVGWALFAAAWMGLIA